MKNKNLNKQERDEAGRYKGVKIDWDRVIELLQKQSTGIAIASIIGIDKATLYERCQKDQGINWVEFRQQHSAIGAERLRSTLYEMAVEDKIPNVAIFLSKNLLGYADKVEQKVQVQEWKVSFDLDTDIEDTSDAD